MLRHTYRTPIGVNRRHFITGASSMAAIGAIGLHSARAQVEAQVSMMGWADYIAPENIEAWETANNSKLVFDNYASNDEMYPSTSGTALPRAKHMERTFNPPTMLRGAARICPLRGLQSTSATFTRSLPKFSPLSSPIRASGALRRPSTTCSRYLSLPCLNHAVASRRNSSS